MTGKARQPTPFMRPAGRIRRTSTKPMRSCRGERGTVCRVTTWTLSARSARPAARRAVITPVPPISGGKNSVVSHRTRGSPRSGITRLDVTQQKTVARMRHEPQQQADERIHGAGGNLRRVLRQSETLRTPAATDRESDGGDEAQCASEEGA